MVVLAMMAMASCTTADTGAPTVQPADATSEQSTSTAVSGSSPTIAESAITTPSVPPPSATTTPAGTKPASAPTPAATLTWAPCDKDLTDTSGIDTSLVDCTTLPVPLDYANPASATIKIALVRYRASGSGKRIGSLLMNPGGPGGSGRQFLVSVVAQNEAKITDLHDRFDMIGFDPRGVDGSNGLSCVDSTTLDKKFEVDITPETPEEKAFAKSLNQQITSACKAKYGDDFLKQINTESTARDMDRIRAAVGDDKLSYLGISYGTYLGSVYATLFPDRVRALVLDGAFDPIGEDELTGNLIQMKGFENAFQNWLAWCGTNPVCAFGPTDVEARWLQLRQQLDDKAIAGDATRTVNQGTFITATIASLYQKAQGWPALGAALRAAANGDGSLLLMLADSQSGRRDDGTYDSLGTAFGVISCESGIVGAPPADKEAAAAALRAVSPHLSFSASADDFGSCEGLPVAPAAAPFSYGGIGPILVIGGKNDPATPFQWAEKMAKDLGPKASLLAYSGEGHSTWLESDCADAAINAILLDLTTTGAKDCAAQAQSAVPLPEWLGTLPAMPSLAPTNIDDLIPLLGLEQGGIRGRAGLSTLNEAAASAAANSSLVAAGWKSLGGQNNVRNYSKKVGAETLSLVVAPIGLSKLSAGSPFTKEIAEHLNEFGKTIIIYGTPL